MLSWESKYRPLSGYLSLSLEAENLAVASVMRGSFSSDRDQLKKGQKITFTLFV